ncbi:ATP-binding protein [Actinomadura soli]|nr:ATP-binding protein [Actinomadura soli]
MSTLVRRGGITRATRGARTFEWRLEERTAGAARRAVRETLAAWGVTEGDIDVAVLLTSEVVTNAIRHVRAELRAGVVWVRVCVTEGRLRVDVTDPEPGCPRLVAALDTDEEHRGMAVVAGCADRWGAPGTGRRQDRVVDAGPGGAGAVLRAAAVQARPVEGQISVTAPAVASATDVRNE